MSKRTLKLPKKGVSATPQTLREEEIEDEFDTPPNPAEIDETPKSAEIDETPPDLEDGGWVHSTLPRNAAAGLRHVVVPDAWGAGGGGGAYSEWLKTPEGRRAVEADKAVPVATTFEDWLKTPEGRRAVDPRFPTHSLSRIEGHLIEILRLAWTRGSGL